MSVTRKEKDLLAKYAQVWTEEKEVEWKKEYNLTNNQLAELKECFLLLDKNGVGGIQASEISTVLRAIGQNPTEQEIEEMTKQVKLSENGTVSFDEYIRVVGGHGLKDEAVMVEDLEEALRVFDRDDCGFIDAEELRTSLKTLSEKFTDEDVEEIMSLANVNADGKMKYKELVKLLAMK